MEGDARGLIKVAVSDLGIIAANLYASNHYTLSNAFWIDGQAEFQAARKGKLAPLIVRLRMDLTNGTDQIAGEITDGTWIAPLTADRAVFNATTRPAPQAGQYTAAFMNDPQGAASGDAVATVSVDTGGILRLTGTLADGTPLSQTVGISKNGSWPLYVNLYGSKGSLLGWGLFTNRNPSSIEGEIQWLKLPSTAHYYPHGLTNALQLIGSHYQPQKDVPVLQLTNGELVLEGGGLLMPVTNMLSLNSNSVATVVGEGKLAVKFATTNGSVNGNFTLGGTNTTIKGIVVPEDGTARGYFLRGSQSGSVLVHESEK